METDAFFYQLFNRLPQTLFELLGLPAGRARAYRFDSVELKKSFRIDGLFVPKKPRMPLYFVEVQYQRSARFYANLFAKIFCYLEENDPMQEWMAVAIFPSKNKDLKSLGPYEEFLGSKRVRRIYLDELVQSGTLSPGLGILKLAAAPIEDVKYLSDTLLANAGDSASGSSIVELVEELLIRRFATLSRQEIRNMFKLTDIRKTRVWQEAHEEGIVEGKAEGIEKGIEKGIEQGIEKGIEQGIEEGRIAGEIAAKKQLIQKWIRKGMSQKAIADLLEIGVDEVRRLAKA
jgi:predicted transposase/invertase (TIGR01784 family)